MMIVCLFAVSAVFNEGASADDEMYSCLMSDSFVRNPDETQIELDVCRDSCCSLLSVSRDCFCS